MVSRSSVLITVFWLLTAFPAWGQPFPGKIIPNVPDESQPTPLGNPNHCAPLAASNLIDYWDNVLCTPGAYNVINGLSRGDAVDSLGWFMDTNYSGSASRANHTYRYPGTLTIDIGPGLDEFVQYDNLNLFGHSAPPPGKSGGIWTIALDTLQGFSFYKAEIDSGRPAILSFVHWNINPRDTLWDPAIGKDIYVYEWDTATQTPTMPGAPEEVWNLLPGKKCAGHAVTGVGYWENCQPAPSLPTTDWAIVHDNWANTGENIAVPWDYWNATVAANVGSYELDYPYNLDPYNIDGNITPTEVTGSLAFVVPKGALNVAYRCTGTHLYIAAMKNGASAVDKVTFCFDPNHNGGTTPQTDDIALTVSADSTSTEEHGDGINWVNAAKTSWHWAMTLSGTAKWQIELEVDYAKLGLSGGSTDTLGFSAWEATPAYVESWPPASSLTVPCAWGDMFSHQLWYPVELASFTAETQDDDVLLTWTTISETNNYGFEILRASGAQAFYSIGFVGGAGTTVEPQSYSWTDRDLSAGIYQYRLLQIDTDGSRHSSQIVTVELLPRRFALSPNFPNPFNLRTVFEISLPRESEIEAKIYSPTGGLVRTLVDGPIEHGSHRLIWDGTDDRGNVLASGVYLLKVSTGGQTLLRKVAMVK